MAFTITQARPVLTAAELELFDQSRAAPIKALTLARLRGKVTRTRTLRDKYRDLFRRQTVSVRKAPSTQSRSPVGADNERTQRKADILQEVLGRFEERVALLEGQLARDAKAPTGKKTVSSAAATPRGRAATATRKAAATGAGNGSAKGVSKSEGAAPATKKPVRATAAGMR